MTLREWCLACLCLLLASCGLPRTAVRTESPGLAESAGRLLNIRVERWDTLRFSGLLGLQEKERGLCYVLLDATGVKLLEAEVAGDGHHNLLRVSGPLKKSDFAPFLSEALARIYLQEPDELPCAGSWFYRLCRQDSGDSGWEKYGQAGPFTVWQVSADRKRRTSGDADESVIYRQPWLGVKISIEREDSGT